MSASAAGVSTDWVTQGVSLALTAMSMSTWFIFLSQGTLLWRAKTQLQRALPVFWQSSNWDAACARLKAIDRCDLLSVLLHEWDASSESSLTLGGKMPSAHRTTRHLRDGLQIIHRKLHWGQNLLATVGATAPFVGLLGTVWGVYHALGTLALAGSTSSQLTIDKIAGPVGDALVMTAAGLAVALPAVVIYNLMNRLAVFLEESYEGFAYDLQACAPHGWCVSTDVDGSPA
jgi:biopolymer transport protein ExbB